MVRKNLLEGLMEAPAPATSPRRTEPPHRGAIGAVSQGIAELRARALVEIAPELIDSGGLEDRLEHDAADHSRLVASITEHGQQVPVLVRPHPSASGRYQIVYGRRRVAACRELGCHVRALVRDLDDQALIIAQGQENSARRDLSFIEKSNFARQMVEAGFRQKAVAEALHIDKSGVSRLLSVARRIPVQLIRTIGSAPSIGRDRWMGLANRLENQHRMETEVLALIEGETSDARFEAVYAALAANAILDARQKPQDPASGVASGTPCVRLQAGSSGTMRLEMDADPAFARWLADQIPALHIRWQTKED